MVASLIQRAPVRDQDRMRVWCGMAWRRVPMLMPMPIESGYAAYFGVRPGTPGIRVSGGYHPPSVRRGSPPHVLHIDGATLRPYPLL